MKLRGNVSAKRRLGGVCWRVGAAEALIWSIGYATASGQSSTGDAYSQMIEAVCRGYAAAVTVVPPNLSFARCMAQRGTALSPLAHLPISARRRNPGYLAEKSERPSKRTPGLI